MLNIVPTNETKICITMWKLETTAKGNFVYVSLLNQQGNSDFEFISVSFSAVMVGCIRYQHTVFLSLAITGIDLNDIIRYPSSSLKYHFNKYSHCLLEKKNNIKA